ncbi:hypothetical protein H2248_009823 [Termitomyces sp. 'cryptogamus']|nr:hypothetical protein H2248_009823 [Termitomyces sp. 'cryptogamus']
MQEAKELANDPSTDYSAAPLEDDIFEWHCTLRGPAGTEFEGGVYHFRILLPAEYPFRPPSLMMLTPNGRFELNTKICISFTNYHEELWQPAWGVRTAIIGLQGFFPLKGQQAVGVGSIEYPSAERKRLATLSREWVCPHCKESNLALLPDPPIVTSAQEIANVAEPSPVPPEAEESAPDPEPNTTSEPRANRESATVHTIDTLLPSGAVAGQTRPGPFITRAAVETPATIRVTRKPPLVLVDGAISRKMSISRRKSLQLHHRPVSVPIPPSLLQSPHLHPQSIFQRNLDFAPHFPTEEDEKWLQDTIPIEHNKKRGRLSTSSISSSSSPTTTDSSMQYRPHSIGPGPTFIPASPPIVRWRSPPHIISSVWHEPSRLRSVSVLAEQYECFESIRPAHIPTPPIARWQRPRHILPSAWHEPPRARSAPPCLEDQDEFFTSGA